MHTDETPMNEVDEDLDIPIGGVLLDRYRVLRELGRGGMGVVFLCRDIVAEIDVAVKTLPPRCEDARRVESFRDTFVLTQGLHHPNIAAMKTLEQDPESGAVYLVMEYVAGETLQERMARPEFGKDKAEIVDLVNQLAEGLHHGHRMGIVHRDVKPNNVMRTREGVYKLLDYGVSADLHETLLGLPVQVTDVTGTPEYMAPEQWRGDAQDARTDQYAIAVLAHELLTGEPPFQSDDLKGLGDVVREEIPHQPKDLPDRVWRVLARGLEKRPEERYATCEDFAYALSKALRGPVPLRERVSGKSGWILGAVAAVLLAVFFTLFPAGESVPQGSVASIEGEPPPLLSSPAIALVPMGAEENAVWTRNCLEGLWSKLDAEPALGPPVTQDRVEAALAVAGLDEPSMATAASLRRRLGGIATHVVGLECRPGATSTVDRGGESYRARYTFQTFHLTLWLIDFQSGTRERRTLKETLAVKVDQFREGRPAGGTSMSDRDRADALLEPLLRELRSWEPSEDS